MKRQHILFPLVLLAYVPLSFPNPGDEQLSICAILPSPPSSPRTTLNSLRAKPNEIKLSPTVPGSMTGEQILKSLKQLNKFYKETGAQEEQLKTATTIVVLQSKE